MRGARLPLMLAIAIALTASAASANATATERTPDDDPVASLEPAKTAALWSTLVRTRVLRRHSAAAECRPLRAVFYAASDWLRLATKLAATASPCAEYYVSVPPLVADKTTFRRDQAWRIRALGSNVHAMAEIHYASWTRWVESTGASWYEAGVTARERIAEAGYDVALGDTWALNELNSAVRRGDGNARTNVRELLRGLYEGDGTAPTRGAALVIGFGQRTGDLSVYQNTLQNWLNDAAFWSDIATYVSDWSQEVYGDIRSHAVPGTPTSVRREYLNDYLQHKLVLATVGPETVEPARAYLRDAYSPLANAAWPRDSAWGWTLVPVDQMTAYVSAQVNAMRWFSATNGQSRDHWGFAWAPRNTTGLTNADFGVQTGQILDRLGAAIRDSGEVMEPENPGSGACGPPGQDTFCLVDLTDARHNEGWRSFRSWALAALAIGNAGQTIPAGTPSVPMTISLVTGTGLSVTSGGPRTVSLRSSSPSGTFASSPSGPWTSTIDTTVAPGAPASFYYLDTSAGRHTLTASAPGFTTGTQTIVVTAGPAVTLQVTPGSAEVRARGVRRFAAIGADQFGNSAATQVTWRVVPAALGIVEALDAGSATFTADRLVRSGRVVATSGSVSASAAVTVSPGRLRVGSIRVRPGKRNLRVVFATVDGARRPVSHAAVRIVVKRDGRRHFSTQARTGVSGKALVRVPAARGCFTVIVTRATAQGFTWDGRTPRNRLCRR